MYCKYCGELLDDDAVFCTKCGNSIKKGQISENPDTSKNESITETKTEPIETSSNNVNTPPVVNTEEKKCKQ